MWVREMIWKGQKSAHTSWQVISSRATSDATVRWGKTGKILLQEYHFINFLLEAMANGSAALLMLAPELKGRSNPRLFSLILEEPATRYHTHPFILPDTFLFS